MPRPDIPPYVEGDRIEDGLGNVAYVRLCHFRSGKTGLRAFIIDGPRKDEFCWPDRLGRPVLDWTPDGNHQSCVECERLFRTGQDESGLRRLTCRTCAAKQRIEDQRRAASTDAVRVGDLRRRVQYPRTATDDVEELIAEDTRDR